MKNNATKIFIIAVCLVGAGFFAYRAMSDSDDRPEDVKIEPPQWICLKCNHAFQLPIDELQDVESRYEEIAGADQSGGMRVKAKPQKQTFIKCPSCKELQAVGAFKCQTCSEVFPTIKPNGEPNTCPKCAPGDSADS